jgi:hypothetical protein
MDLINTSALLARKEEGFIPRGMAKNSLVHLKQDLAMVAESIVQFIKEIVYASFE